MNDGIGYQLTNSQLGIHRHFFAEGLADLFIGRKQCFKIVDQPLKADGIAFVAFDFPDGFNAAITLV
ncbi:hypothetical protein [Oceanisphaera sp. KMM 10153]|uniref:hypothetical protein n=1 Tax=Oceanisphaera submarina TaxID=3390193 RepID=UPI00397694DE